MKINGWHAVEPTDRGTRSCPACSVDLDVARFLKETGHGHLLNTAPETIVVKDTDGSVEVSVKVPWGGTDLLGTFRRTKQ